MIILKNLFILSMASPEFKGDIAIDPVTKRIVKVQESITPQSNDTVYDLSGKYATPGFIDAHTHIGMFEDGMGFEGDDGNEATNPVTPEMRAIDAVNPFDPCFREAVAAGVTTVVTGPGSANVIGGQFVVLNTSGESVEDMIFDHANTCPVAMKAAMGENPKRVYSAAKVCPTTRMGTAAILRKTLAQAVEYNEKKQLMELDPEKKVDLDFALEQLLPVIRRELPLKVHCHRADDILTAIRIANEFNILFTLDHCTEGYMIAKHLKCELTRNLRGIIIGPLLCDRGKIETRNLSFTAPRVLFEAGVPFAMMTDSPVIPQQYLPVCASIAVREGLPEDEALKMITINAAKIVGIDDAAGTIEAGKYANIAVFNSHPLDTRSRCVMTLIDGKIVHNELD